MILLFDVNAEQNADSIELLKVWVGKSVIKYRSVLLVVGTLEVQRCMQMTH